MIKNISVFGGTHGNEWTGVYVVKEYPFEFDSLNIKYHLSNPKAYELNRRYIDKDLNRCFSLDYLEQQNNDYEHKRALEILELIRNDDFVIDLHTTTSNMGPTLIITTEDPFVLKIAKEAQSIYSEIKIIKEIGDMYLVSRGRPGIIVEVGPCPQGILKDKCFTHTINCLKALFESIKRFNDQKEIGCQKTIYYEAIGKVDYPRNEKGAVTGMVSDVVRCFSAIQIGDPLFKSFDGQEITNQKYTGFPIFVSEAAYFEKGVAFVLTEQRVC